ncbi:MAG: PEP-CTERM sorting domain-containing protein [Planctomycetota bacterium]
MKYHCTAALITTAALSAGTSDAAQISLAGASLTPDDTNAIETTFSDINTPNGGSSVLGNPDTVYLITTFSWGLGSDAHMTARFNFDAPGASNDRGRAGISAEDTGVFSWAGTGANVLDYPTNSISSRTNFDLAQDMAGQTVTILVKFYREGGGAGDISTLYNIRNGNNGNPSNGSDVLMNAWINLDANDVEGSGLSAGDMYALWNIGDMNGFKEIVENRSTPSTAGDSSISNTVILTGSDATFANALLAAGVPEPGSLALLAMGCLLIARRRRA